MKKYYFILRDLDNLTILLILGYLILWRWGFIYFLDVIWMGGYTLTINLIIIYIKELENERKKK